MDHDAPNNYTHVIVGPSEFDPEVAKTILNRAKVARNCVLWTSHLKIASSRGQVQCLG
jgi:hypothetical protein